MNFEIYNGINENNFKIRYPDIWWDVRSKFIELPFMEALYRYVNNIKETPTCTCGKPCKFRSFTHGYQQFCSAKCSNSNQDKKQKCKDTCIEKYGGVAPACSKEVSKKMVETSYTKHGDECFKRRKGPLKEETKEKMRKTCLERYGVENVMQQKDYAKQHNNNKDYKKLSQLVSEAWEIKMKHKYPDIIDIDHINKTYKIKCNNIDCNKCKEKWFEIPIALHAGRRNYPAEMCTRLRPIVKKALKNTWLEQFIKNILDEYNISYVENDKKLLEGKELDIYIPDHKLAIECNGIYWHSLKEPSYHFNKWYKCKEQDIQLITIWEDQIHNQPEIVKGIIKSRLGIYEHQIGARKCILKEVPSKESIEFLKNNHLQGSTNGNIRLGLYYNDELVSIMVFGAKRRALGNKETNENTYELYRYCNKLGWQIQGGASRLFKYFINSHKDSIIESFSSNDISMGDLYKKLGFEHISTQKSSYWYIEQDTFKRYHRYSFTKYSLVQKGYDRNLTESQIMETLPYWKIYDSGQQKWLYE